MIVNDQNYQFELDLHGSPSILLFNPFVYDVQYWARWSQPAGLLRLSTYLKSMGCTVRLIDCMEANTRGLVPKTRRRTDNGEPCVFIRDEVSKVVWHYGLTIPQVEERLAALRDSDHPPEVIFVGSIMTYWWESTRDAVRLLRRYFPEAQIVVGGIYPTLAPDHADQFIDEADYIFQGELIAASDCPTDLTLYERPPTYAIIATSRGCPWDCDYCAARTLNGGSSKLRTRSAEHVVDEIQDKVDQFGIRHFGFYEDNALARRGHLQSVLELILERGLNLDLYAPEGFETRMLNVELLRVMKRAGFRKIHLPFEMLTVEANLIRNRRHASTASFDAALAAAVEAGFKLRTEEINAFVLFGLPDERLEDVMDSVLYIHHEVGSVIPMLFTPVPGTNLYRQHEQYLRQEMGWDLHNLNGKLLPFLEYNRRHRPELRAQDYLDLEALMSVLNNGKFMSRAVNLCGDALPSSTFRTTAIEHPQANL